MRKFAITSAKFSGEITYTYDNEGYMTSFYMNADLTPEQKHYILGHMPLSIDEVEEFLKKPSLKLIEVPFKVTFDMFWDKYNDKDRSSKKKTVAKWDKMNDTDQSKAFFFIDKYNRKRGNAEKKYAETFLNAELWNN